MSDKKQEKVVLDIYRELFSKSTPSADFDKLVEAAPINEHNQKVIDYNAYEIDYDEYTNIVESEIKKYRMAKWEKQMIRNTIALGCSPKFKK
jgi:hypothetical protein